MNQYFTFAIFLFSAQLVSFAVSEESATCNVFKGHDISTGDDLASRYAENPEDCCAICSAYPGCNAWTHNVSPPTCYLKSGTTLGPAYDETTTVGILIRKPDAVEDSEAETPSDAVEAEDADADATNAVEGADTDDAATDAANDAPPAPPA